MVRAHRAPAHGSDGSLALDAMRTSGSALAPDLAGPVRFVDAHSGRGSWLSSFAAIRALVDVVVQQMEAAGHGRRFPLLHVVEARRPLSGTECEALVWEIARVRTILSTLPARIDPAAQIDPAARIDPPAPVDSGTLVAPLPRRTLAEVHGETLSALDLAARLGAASRRGARFEAADGPSDAGPVANSVSGPAGDSTAANSR